MTDNTQKDNSIDTVELIEYDCTRNGDAIRIKNAPLIAYKRTLKITDEQHDVLIGTLLGHASMSQRNGRPHYSIKFEQREINEQYVHHLFDIFSPFVGTGPRRRDKKTTNEAVSFRTIQHDSFIYYWDLFYECEYVDNQLTNKKKIVPQNIQKLLTPRAIAYWFMDDGTYGGERYSDYKNSLFSAQGFTKHGCELLQEALKIKFGIETSLQKDSPGYKIAIPRSHSPKFVELIGPYILDCFLYKL